MSDITSITRERGMSAIATPAAPARRSGIRRTLARAATVGSCLACGLLAVPAIASATVSNTASQWAELGSLAYTGGQTNEVTAVYSIQNLAEPGDALLEDNGNAMSNGALTDVWGQVDQATGQDPMADQNGHSYGAITQANELWEFVPESGNTGGQITTGFGELINRQSGLCLDVNGSDPNEYGDGATVDQWTCGGGPNQEWTSLDLNNFPGGSGYTLVPDIDGGSGSLGVGNSTCNPQGSGDPVYVRTTGEAHNTCDEWNLQQTSYDFATYPLGVSAENLDESDNREYSCTPGYNLRVHGSNKFTYFYDFGDISSGGVGVDISIQVDGEDGAGSSNPNEVTGFDYANNGNPNAGTGQILLYCDPSTSNP